MSVLGQGVVLMVAGMGIVYLFLWVLIVIVVVAIAAVVGMVIVGKLADGKPEQAAKDNG